MKTKMLSLTAGLLMAACSSSGAPAAASTDTSVPTERVQVATPEEPEGEAVQERDNTLMRVISGQVMYRERIALPDGAIVTVELQDQSRADAPATVLTDYQHTVDGGPPYDFRLVYNPDAIDEHGRYGLRARIEYDGKLLFTSTEHIDPFAVAPGDKIDIMVRKSRS